jgi:Co/Zn/Cd efflux system component
MEDKIRIVLAILGILALCIGSIIILASFSIRVSAMMEPGFLTLGKSTLGLIAVLLLLLGIAIFSWLWKDII